MIDRRSFLSTAAASGIAMSHADFAKLLAVDYERMAKVVKVSGAKVE